MSLPKGYKWRSSNWFILLTIAIALFAGLFIRPVVVTFKEILILNRKFSVWIPSPNLGLYASGASPYRPSQTQMFTSAVLALHGALAMLSSPIIGHFADKSPNRKSWLLSSLILCIIGTCLVAVAHSVGILIIGRAMQGVAGSAVWIIGFSTVASIFEENERGFGLGMMTSLANTGTIIGPAVSGLLLEAAARVIMIELVDTNAPLSLDDNSRRTGSVSTRGSERKFSNDKGFWRIMLTDGRALTCLLITITIQEIYGWGPTIAGLLFIGLVVPGLLIGPLPAGPVTGLEPEIPLFCRKSTPEAEPDAFGSQGSLSRVFSMLDAGATLGMMIGPIIGGSLRTLIGYTYMNWIWSLSYLIIAVLALTFLEPKETYEPLESDEEISKSTHVLEQEVK
ncbi:putative mfs transporter protein [Botrytis fragariae]|uniref:Putative mfs transporter protein n=1 Tax=Botrytis fragariae TaxID=1964551 RepID=A0A8H6B4T7_9HELO|nr:putative mfs transporter protein [Botrytis fragariae]KAF5879012.1 putative mfs transporter protein [Botrytis fragariae]